MKIKKMKIKGTENRSDQKYKLSSEKNNREPKMLVNQK